MSQLDDIEAMVAANSLQVQAIAMFLANLPIRATDASGSALAIRTDQTLAYGTVGAVTSASVFALTVTSGTPAVGQWLTINGQQAQITTYSGGVATVSPALSSAPTAGNAWSITSAATQGQAGGILSAISGVAAAVWNVLTSTLTAAGSIGKRILTYLKADSGNFDAGQLAAAPTAAPTAVSRVNSGPIVDGNLAILQNSAWLTPAGQPVSILVADTNGNPIDLSGLTLRMEVYSTDFIDPVSFEFTTDIALSISGANSNLIVVTASNTNTGRVGSYRYVIWTPKTTNANQYPIARGVLIIQEERQSP